MYGGMKPRRLKTIAIVTIILAAVAMYVTLHQVAETQQNRLTRTKDRTKLVEVINRESFPDNAEGRNNIDSIDGTFNTQIFKNISRGDIDINPLILAQQKLAHLHKEVWHIQEELQDSQREAAYKPKPFHVSGNDDESVCERNIALNMLKDMKRGEIPFGLYKIAPEIFDNVPVNFLDGIRSPCWRRSSDNEIICLPSFILSGVGKCGTTDVWDKIVQHPDIVRVFKEPRWWTRTRFGRDRPKGKPVSVHAYFNHFEKLSSIVSNNITAAKRLLIGEGSPSIYWDNVLWKNTLTGACANATTPTYLISDVIRAILPHSKIITVFRNPVDRLYSDYLFDNKSCTKEFFHQSVVKTTRLFDSCLSESSRRTCVFQFFSYLFNKVPGRKSGGWPTMRLFKGFYSVFIADWMDAFPRDQLKFIRLEDWHQNCEEMLPEMYIFLDLSPLSATHIKQICSTKQRNPTSGKKKRGPMLSETRNILEAFYSPTLKELASILGDDRFLWKD